MSLNESTILKKVEAHRGRKLRERREIDRFVIIGLHAYFEMGDHEHYVYDAMDGQRTVQQITQITAEKFNVDYETALAQVLIFTGQLVENKLAESVGNA
jgi:predicted nuclease of restriction endonuclease-like RecB superfamily